jgi:hypothetical protein
MAKSTAFETGWIFARIFPVFYFTKVSLRE